jgi:hypothetical protein
MTPLQTESTLRLTAKQAAALVCHAGVLWLTREGDVRDLFLTPGERVEIGPGLTLVTALEPAIVSLQPPRRRWLDLLHAWRPAAAASARNSTA